MPLNPFPQFGTVTPKEETGQFTAFPNVLLDQVMPSLRDTEWRLLCVIVRQTVGWTKEGKPKARDWMSQSQLMKKTGRNSAALSAALRQLVGRGLIEAQTPAGELLDTPQARRRHRGPIYYAVGWTMITAWESNAKSNRGTSKPTHQVIHITSESELQKANTTKERLNKTLLVHEKRIDSGKPRISSGQWSSVGEVMHGIKANPSADNTIPRRL